jgi:antirestriction protein ArdC
MNHSKIKQLRACQEIRAKKNRQLTQPESAWRRKELEFAADPKTGDAETATRLFARATPVYLASWLSVLKADKKAIFTAASKASEAAAFLAALQGA